MAILTKFRYKLNNNTKLMLEIYIYIPSEELKLQLTRKMHESGS
jgi:hypothetical protein